MFVCSHGASAVPCVQVRSVFSVCLLSLALTLFPAFRCAVFSVFVCCHGTDAVSCVRYVVFLVFVCCHGTNAVSCVQVCGVFCVCFLFQVYSVFSVVLLSWH